MVWRVRVRYFKHATCYLMPSYFAICRWIKGLEPKQQWHVAITELKQLYHTYVLICERIWENPPYGIIISTLGQKLSVVISTFCYRCLRVLNVTYQGKISLSLCAQSLLLRVIKIQLDSSNYWTLTHLLSFLGIREAALIINVGVQY